MEELKISSLPVLPVFLLEMQRQAELIGHLCNEPVAGG